MLGSGWSEDALFLAACSPKGVCAVRATHGVATLDVFWSWLRLGFDALFHGRPPSTDPDGSKLKSLLAGESAADGNILESSGVLRLTLNTRPTNSAFRIGTHVLHEAGVAVCETVSL